MYQLMRMFFSIIDIIGQPYDISDVQIIQIKGEDRKRVQFRMRDLR